MAKAQTKLSREEEGRKCKKCLFYFIKKNIDYGQNIFKGFPT